MRLKQVKDKANAPNELLDLVNKDDEVIGEILKGKANQDPDLIHREIGVIIYDNENKVLLQQRSLKKKVHPGLWAVSCAGHVPKGMKPLDAAHMELREELGFDTTLHFVEKNLDEIPTETRFVYWFTGKYPGDKIKLEPEEVEQVKWVSQENFKKFVNENRITKASRIMLERFWKRRSPN